MLIFVRDNRSLSFMTGLKLDICFWYVDDALIDEIVGILRAGNYAPVYDRCRKARELESRMQNGVPDLIIADFDLPEILRNTIENLHSSIAFHVPLIYLVGEKNEEKAAETLRRGVWDYLVKDHFVKLVPTVYSSQKFGKVLRQSRKVRSELEESREQFRNLAENSPDLIVRFDRKVRCMLVNQSVAEYTGISVEEFIGRRPVEILSTEAFMHLESATEAVVASEKQRIIELEFSDNTKKLVFEWRIFPELDEQKQLQSVLAIGRDITESKKASEAIRMSEERLQLAVEATSLGYWDWNLEQNKVFFSPIYLYMLGYNLGELPQRLETFHNLLHEDDREEALATVDRFIRSGEESFETEFRLRSKEGRYIWICGRGRVVERAADGTVRRLIGTHENISERKRNEQIQATLFNISNAVNTTLNLEELYEKIREHLGQIVDTTNCFLALYNEQTGMLTLPFLRDEKDSFTEFPTGKTLTGYVISTGKTQLVDAEREQQLTEEGLIEPVGTPCVSWLGVPLKTGNSILGVFAVQSYKESDVYTKEDVSILEFVSDQIALAIKRKHDQDNIIDNQEKQRRIFESSPDPIIVVDRNRKVIDYNTSLLSAVNVTNEPVMGRNILLFVAREDWRKAFRDFNKTWELGYMKNMEYTLRKADGTTFKAEVSTGAIYNNKQKPDSMVIIFKDITERKEAEENLREAKERAEESDRLKTAFLSNMSHEIRTPMNAIVGFSDLLNDSGLTPSERAEFIAQINLGADNLMHLIDDIIDISKIEAGQVKIIKKNCDIHKLIQEQIVLFKQNLARIDKPHIDLRLNWRWPSETLVLYSDQFRLKQIISNLLNNAIKFTDEGYIELGIEKVNSMVRIYVRDTGIGISPENLEVIFERFRQGHQSKTKIYGGTGLGLAISRNLAELLGGSVGVTSDAGRGSEFWLTLPADEVKDALPEEEVKKNKVLANWKDKTILIAEDDELNYKLLVQALKSTGVKMIRAATGKETVRLFEQHAGSLDLVLMDIRMPDMDGYHCTRKIKSMVPQIPVIAQTAYAMSGEREVSQKVGCDDYISKPIDIKVLKEKLAYYLK
jgi:two-component system, sensor histidine kinase and response regulator